MAAQLNQEDFLTRALVHQNNTIDLSKAVYTNIRTKVKVSCTICTNSWDISPKVLMRDKIKCPFCENRHKVSSSYGNEPTTLYIISIRTDSDELIYKIGITKYSVLQRFLPDDLRRINVLKEWKFPSGEEAFKYEKALHDLLKEFRYRGDFRLSSHGNTELFTINPLEKLKSL